MMNLDKRKAIEEERAKFQKAEAQETQPLPETQPEDNGGKGKLFTQEEVNKIVSERLARERAKSEPTAEERREQELVANENRLQCREFLESHGYDEGLLDVFDTSDAVKFQLSVEKLLDVLETSREHKQRNSSDMPRKNTLNDLFMEVFGLKKKE